MKSSVKVFAVTTFGETVLNGTIEDIRTDAKNRWSQHMVNPSFANEEEYYLYLDLLSDEDLITYVGTTFGHDVVELCDVPVEDFQH